MVRNSKSSGRFPTVSFSSLSLLRECKGRCFWLHMRGRPRPGKPMPGILIRMDLDQKAVIESVIAGASRPEVLAEVPGRFIPIPHSSGASLTVQVEELRLRVVGKLDALVDVGGAYVPVDNKTFGKAKPASEVAKYYSAQGSLYGFLLQSLGYPVPRPARAIFIQWIPHVRREGGARIETQVTEIVTPIEDASALLRRAREVLDGPTPEPDADCDYCMWAETAGESQEGDAR